MSKKPPNKPCLKKLKGSTKLSTEQRQEFDIAAGLLINCVKEWPNIKKVVDSYLADTSDTKEDSPNDFHDLLIATLKKIKAGTVHNDVLLSDYCKHLIMFFQHEQISKKLKQNYLHQSTLYRMNMNQRALALQSRNTALIATREESLYLEDEMIARIENRGKKRQYEKNDSTDEEGSQSENGGIVEEDRTSGGANLLQSQETSMIMDESFDSVEKHPNVRSFYNYFVGDQKQGWTLDGERHWITKDGFDVSQVLFKYRLASYRAAKMMLDLSDERILSLSFIFLINERDSNEGFISTIKREEDAIRNFLPTVLRLSTNEQGMMMAFKIDECKGDQQQVKRYLAHLHAQHWNPVEEATIYFDILNAFSQRVKRINDTHTEQDHDLYEVFTKETFNHKKYTQHKISKHLSGSKEYVPDYKLAYMYKEKQMKDLFIIEIKKKEKLFTPNTSDKIKINLEMQVMLNDLIKINVDEPVVYGLTIQDHSCYLYEMKIEYNCQYISRVIQEFYLPRDVSDVCLVPRVTSIFLTVKSLVDQMITKINQKKKGVSHLKPYTREGMKMPIAIRDPVSYMINNQSDDYVPP